MPSVQILQLSPEWSTPCFAKLNQLEWIDGFAVEIEGVRIGIRANDSSTLDDIRRRLPPFAKPTAATECDCIFSFLKPPPSQNKRVRPYHLLYMNHVRIARSDAFEDLFSSFGSMLTTTVASLAKERLFIHAGCVAWNGQAIILPGCSMAGKSTLVAEFLKAGAEYLSDDFAVIDRQSRVHPYLKPVSLREDGSLDQTDYHHELFGARAAVGSMPVGVVLFTRYAANADWDPIELTPGQTFLALLRNSPASRLSTQRVVDRLQHLSLRTRAFETLRTEASVSVQRIIELIDNKEAHHASVI